jgi:hypothetical protein
MGKTDHPLGVIVSQFVYETTIRQRHSAVKQDKLKRAEIAVKETQTTGWIWLEGGPLSPARSKGVYSLAE